MSFQISALPAEPFAPLFAMSDAALAARLSRRVIDEPGAPCRVSLIDAAPGETLILTHYEHQSAATPFRAGHAIYVREGAIQARPEPDAVPDQLRSRTLSLRGFDAAGMMIAADIADGVAVEQAIEALFVDPGVAICTCTSRNTAATPRAWIAPDRTGDWAASC